MERASEILDSDCPLVDEVGPQPYATGVEM